MNYVSITPEQRRAMLDAVGVDSIDELFEAIPADARFAGDLDLPPAASELQLQRELIDLAGQNRGADRMACFMGGGAYDHFVPSFIDQMISRGEFLTAYTPYQAEASQGSLQAFFEFQTQVARLAGLDIANASLYEGASSLAEAVTLAINVTGKRRVLIASTIHPDHRAVLKSHLEDLPVEMVTLPAGEDGLLSAAVVEEHADADTACLVVQSPNVFGLIEDAAPLFETFKGIAGAKGKAPLAISVFNPIACALLKTPGASGADVAVGEGQPLGIPLQFGGPYLGLFAAKDSLIRKMPGRLVGITSDDAGRRAFSLILQTREQHIRGAKATSNVCTNQGLLALRATMYMSAVGPQGLREIAEQCWHKAHWLAGRIESLEGYERLHAGDFFNEFVIRCPKPAAAIIDHARSMNVLAGVDLSTRRIGSIGDERDLLIAVTEKRSRAEMERLLQALQEAAKA